MDDRGPRHVRVRSGLVLADGDEPFGRVAQQRVGPRKVQPAVERRDDRDGADTGQQQAGPFHVRVDQVEFGSARQDLVERQLHVRQRIAGVAKGAERLGHGLDVSAGHHGIAAGEGRDFVTSAVELRDQPVHDALRPAVRPRWHALEGRGDLGDAERTSHGT